MAELFHGPVEQWELDAEGWLTIEKWLTEGSEVEQVNAEAYLAGCYVAQFAMPRPTWAASLSNESAQIRGIMVPKVALPENETLAVGVELQPLVELFFRETGERLGAQQPTIYQFIRLGAFVGKGETRADRLRSAMEQVIRHQTEPSLPKPGSPIVTKLGSLGITLSSEAKAEAERVVMQDYAAKGLHIVKPK